VSALGNARNLAPMPAQGGGGLCWCCIGAVSVAPEDADDGGSANESYMPALESMFEGASQPELPKVEGVGEEDDMFDDAKKFVRTVSAGFNPAKVGPINKLSGTFELKKSEQMFRFAHNILELRRLSATCQESNQFTSSVNRVCNEQGGSEQRSKNMLTLFVIR
jgi:hypothetical protein